MAAFANGSGKPPASIDYLKQANDTLLTIVQIETREALEDVQAIAKTDGVDVSALQYTITMATFFGVY